MDLAAQATRPYHARVTLRGMPRDRGGRAIPTMALALLVAACGQAGAPSSQATHPESEPTATSSSVITTPAVAGSFAVGKDASELELLCYGQGAPAVVFEAGTDSSGIDAFRSLLTRLASTNLTCAYDRAGTGRSDPPTKARRTLNDVVADTDALLAAAKIPPPYLLVGQSGGGNIAVWYAVRHPENVAGLVLIDAGRDDPEAMAGEFPGSQAWAGAEHIDWADAARREWDLGTPIGDYPLLILTADEGQGDPDAGPSPWLELSPASREVVLHGGHDLHVDNPEEVVEQIRSILDGL